MALKTFKGKAFENGAYNTAHCEEKNTGFMGSLSVVDFHKDPIEFYKNV